MNPSVLIVGAGPTGLALAVWLTRFGVAVRIIDKTAEAAPPPALWPYRFAHWSSIASWEWLIRS